MIAKKITLINKYGLHARAAAKFVSIASRSSSKISVHYLDKIANGKSIMDIMMLAAVLNSELEIRIDGVDEHEVLTNLEKLINERFGEKE